MYNQHLNIYNSVTIVICSVRVEEIQHYKSPPLRRDILNFPYRTPDKPALLLPHLIDVIIHMDE